MIATTLLLASFGAAQMDTARTPQGVEYTIEARLNEETDILEARAELRYTNNAAVALDTLWFHQHLNAFRPGSAWARRELRDGNRRFQDLGPEDHAFERISLVEVDGRAARTIYPGAPDSTVVGIPLAAPLAPGATAVVRFEWTARPSTLPRRQGRRDRRFDFAQWYPRIASYDRGGWQTQALMPQGEFYGEFGSYEVTLDLASDQVIGATGLVVEGDPGWRERARPGYDVIVDQSGFYPAAAPRNLGFLPGNAAAGRKRIRWRADDVHHFAWSVNPDYNFEGGTVRRLGVQGGDIAINVLFGSGDTDWANGVALTRTQNALTWLQEIFGPYPWPQLTNLRRIESGGTEFPMVLMDGSPSEGLILHEAAHQYMHGILANNEFDEGWIDEGFASFLTTWYFEDQGDMGLWEGTMAEIRDWERARRTELIAKPGEEFRDPGVYSTMTYTKTELILRMLRDLIGEEAMRAGMKLLYERRALSHVNEADLRTVFSEVAGEDLSWFFEQWFHTTDRLDYSITAATSTQQPNGSWTTRVDVQRDGDAFMPVTLQVGGQTRRLTARERRQSVEVNTPDRPTEVVLDPENVLIDIDISNNRRETRAP